jgi:uncharacterized metal-binding protein YceD (DUF177 family)
VKQPLLVYIERLREGKVELIEEKIDPARLDIAEEDFICKEPIEMKAEVYLVDTWLIVKMSFTTQVTLSCSFCNEPFVFPIEVKDEQYEESLEEIKDSVLDLLPLIREALFLEIPFYPQCGNTVCRNRDEIEKYLKKEESKGDEYHLPFEAI